MGGESVYTKKYLVFTFLNTQNNMEHTPKEEEIQEEFNKAFPPPMLLGQNQEKVADYILKIRREAIAEDKAKMTKVGTLFAVDIYIDSTDEKVIKAVKKYLKTKQQQEEELEEEMRKFKEGFAYKPRTQE